MKKLISRKFTRASQKLHPANKSKPAASKKKEHTLNVAKATRSEQSPSNSRAFTERVFSSTNVFVFFICFVSGALLMVLLLEENTIRLNLISLQTLTAQHAGMQRQVAQWQNVVTKHPDYRDGYFQLAVVEYQLGNMNKAYIYDEDALRLDPNFQSGRELEKKLQMSSQRE